MSIMDTLSPNDARRLCRHSSQIQDPAEYKEEEPSSFSLTFRRLGVSLSRLQR